MENFLLWLMYNISLQSWVEISSLICMFLTITVYIYVNKLRNHLGMCLVFLLFSRFVSELHLYFDVLGYSKKLQKGFCLTVASGLWSIAFSHLIWKGLKVPNCNDSRNRFLAYNIFAWGTAASLTTVIFLLDYYITNEQYLYLLPGVGRTRCWLDISCDNKAFRTYIEIPHWLIDSYTVIVFTLTAFHIAKVKSDVRKFNRNDDRRTKLRSDKKNFLMLLRLFVIMALSWSFTVLGHLMEGDIKMAVKVMTIYYHESFGIIIFALFIIKRSTLRLLVERIRNTMDWITRRQTA